ncbi:hypothetical protein QFZ26_001828 [Agromyces ramosus]|uniref:Uncharacterized protein n=1 Tax=Agromyces ramosus TaxID=33879 RepID=A0ABU0R870_9MICO|nr:hypothetical protein [Agromyces ramosus]
MGLLIPMVGGGAVATPGVPAIPGSTGPGS